MHKLLLILFFALPSLVLHAQKTELDPLQKIYQSLNNNADIVHAVLLLTDGRIACAGETQIPYQGKKGLLLIFNPAVSNSPKRIIYQSSDKDEQFFALVEDIDGSILLAGQQGGRPLLYRADRFGENGTELFTPDSSKLPLMGIARLGNGTIIAASLDNGNLQLYQLMGDSLHNHPFKNDYSYCKDLVSMHSDANTGGIWICGNTKEKGNMEKNRAWILHLNQDGKTIDNNNHSIGPGNVLNTYVCTDSKLLLSGLNEEGNRLWYAYRQIEKEGNSFSILEDVYANAVCQSGNSIFFYVKSIHNKQDILTDTTGKIITTFPDKLQHTQLLTYLDGSIWIIGNLKKNSGVYVGRYAYQSEYSSKKSEIVLASSVLVKNNNDKKNNNKRLGIGERAAIALCIRNKGAGSSEGLVVFAEVIKSKSDLRIIHDSINAIRIAPLASKTATTVFLGIRPFEYFNCKEDSVQIKLWVNENSAIRLIDTITIYFDFKLDIKALEITQPTTAGNFVTKNVSQHISLRFYSKNPNIEAVKEQIMMYQNGILRKSKQLICQKYLGNECYFNYECTCSILLSEKDKESILFKVGNQADSILIEHKKPDLYVFALGMTGNPKLSCALNDAYDFINFAKNQKKTGQFNQVFTVLVKDQTRDSIIENLKRLIYTLEGRSGEGLENDYFMFYYSGHGKVENGDFLIPTESPNNAIKMVGDLGQDYLNKVKLRKFVFIDACRTNFDGTSEPKSLTDAVTFYSCRNGAASKEPTAKEKIRNSYFTTAIFELGGYINLDEKICSDCDCCTTNDNKEISIEILGKFLENRMPRFGKNISTPIIQKGPGIKGNIPVFYKIDRVK